MRISRNYKPDDWTKLDFSTEAGWQKAVDILHDRLQTCYLEHIAVLLKRKTSGFVVLALDSALIETLQQFQLGEPETPWGQGQQHFVDFLTQTSFSQYFDGPKAALFYTTIRCGLLHQTEAGSAQTLTICPRLPPSITMAAVIFSQGFWADDNFVTAPLVLAFLIWSST